MKSAQKVVLIIIIMSILATGSWFGYEAVKWVKADATETKFNSAMSWLDVALGEALADYYKAHNHYPEKLSELTIDFPGDNAKPEMLDEFKYSSDGKRYEVTWVMKRRGETLIHKRKGIEGKSSYTLTHINNRLPKTDEEK